MGFVGLGVCVVLLCFVLVGLLGCSLFGSVFVCDGVLCGLWAVCGWVYVFGVILVC